ncbi:flavin reductase family protein [Georgenia sp. AZ-5]|uniref:flavin reductase family protein n=1 Tax=Georgenia sp. AZ-5 TaxID=3367526 RepID=UPI0037545F16
MTVATVEPRGFRTALSRFASGVIVMTATSPQGDVHGMTASSFLSVSLDPPLVLVSVDRRTRMHDFLGPVDHYGVSVLAHDQQDVAGHFAGRPCGLVPRFVWRDGVPLLDGALAHLTCRMYDRHTAGDHTLFIGEVRTLNYDDGAPLIFFSGAFDRLTPKGALA